MDEQPPLREKIVFLRRRSPGPHPAPRPDATRMRLTITTTVALIAWSLLATLLLAGPASAHVYGCSVHASTPTAGRAGFINYRTEVQCNEVQPETLQNLDLTLEERIKYPDGGYSNWEPVHATESEQLGSYTKAAEYPCLAGQGAYYRTRVELYYFHGTSGFKTDTSGYRYISCR